MTTQRLWPTVQAIGRTIVYNRPDIFQQSARVYHSHNAQLGHNFNCPLVPYSNGEERFRFSQDLFHRGSGVYLKVVSKQFSSGVHLFCREFTDGENEHAHDILRSLPAYESTTVDTKPVDLSLNMFRIFPYRDKYWPSIGSEEMVHTFVCISKKATYLSSTLEDQQYHKLCLSLIERIPFMSDDQLLRILSALSLWPPTQNENSSKFNMLWKSLDEACFKRLENWNISKIFLFADHWYALRISKLTMYFTKLLNKLGINILSVTPTQFVQYMFYVNLNREFGFIKQVHLEKKMKESLEHITIEELGIIAMALFKTETTIFNPDILDFVIEKTKPNIHCISDHALASILKFLSRNFPGNAHRQCYEFLETLHPHIERFNNFVLLQMALFGNHLLVFHRGVISKIGVRFDEQMSLLRLKDIERFTYCLMLYKFIPPGCLGIVDKIVNELRRPERIVEINHFPRCFTSCVNYIVAMGIFPHDLISAALQPSMVELLKSNSYDGDLGRELNELNWTVKIELPSTYLGFTLDPYQSNALTKNFMGKIPHKNSKKLNNQERFLLDVQKKISAMAGMEGFVEPAIVLPHFVNPDLIFCTTIDGDPVELPAQFRHFPMEVLKPASQFAELDLLWNIVMIAGRNSVVRETKEIKGNLEMKRRQLIKLGYKVSVIPHRDYVKTSLKFKLGCLEKILGETSSLAMEGRKDQAFRVLKAQLNDVIEDPPESVACES